MKPTFTDVNGVKVKCTMATDKDVAHLIISKINEDESLSQILELNLYDAKFLYNACDNFVKNATALNFMPLGALSADEAQKLGHDLED